MALFIILLIVIAAIIIGLGIVFAKARNKATKKVMQVTGLGNVTNEKMDQVNAKALAKLEVLYKEGKITQEQYEKRKKNLSYDHDYNK